MIRLQSSLLMLLVLAGTLPWMPAEPCSPEEIARLKAEYLEKAQQFEDLESSVPMVDQLSELRGYLDELNEAAGETKSDINEFVEDNKQILDLMKTEVKTYNEQLQRWSPSVYSNDALEGNTTTTKKEVSVTEGLNVTAERLGQLEKITKGASDAFGSLEAGMRAQTPADQLRAFQTYFDTMTGFVNNDEMKAAFPVLHVFAPWFEYFSKALEFAAFMTEDIQRSADMRNRMLQGIGAARTKGAMSNSWFTGISYSPPQRSPYELLTEQKEKLQAELDEIAGKLEDCGQEVPETNSGRPTTGETVDRFAFPEGELGNILELCYSRTGIDPTTAGANEAALREARGRANAAAHRLSRERWKLGIPDGEISDNEEIRKLEENLREARAEYQARLEPVAELKNCVLQYYMGFFAARNPGEPGIKPTSELKDLPDHYKYEQFKNCEYWELDEFAQSTIGTNLPNRPTTGSDAQDTGAATPTGAAAAGAATGSQGGEPGEPESEDEEGAGIPAPDAAGDVSAPAATGAAAAGAGAGGAGGMGAVLATGNDFPPAETVPAIEFEIMEGVLESDPQDDAPPPTALPQAPGVPTQGSDSPVTGDGSSGMEPEDPGWINPIVNPMPLNSGLREGLVDETTQPMMLDVFEMTLAHGPDGFPRTDGPEAVPGHGGSLYLATDGKGGLALIRGAEKTRSRDALSSDHLDDPKVTAILTSLGVSTGEAFEVIALNEGDIPIQISGDGIVVEPVKLKDEAQKQLQTKLSELASRNPVTARLNAYCLEFLARPPTAGQLFRIASTELQQEFAPMRNILKAGRRVFEGGLLNPDSDPTAYMHSIKQWALWSHEKNFDLDSFTEAFLEHTRKNFEAAGRDWSGDIEDAVRAVLPNRWNDIQKVLTAADATADAGAGD